MTCKISLKIFVLQIDRRIKQNFSVVCKIYINIILLMQTYDRVQELISIEQLQIENSWCCLHWYEISAETDEDLRQNGLLVRFTFRNRTDCWTKHIADFS